MLYFDAEKRKRPAVGITCGTHAVGFVKRRPGVVDYVEIPFEQLRHDPNAALLQNSVPLLLHCASMSVAGYVSPADSTLAEIANWARRTRTPWIGEHLAFVLAHPMTEGAADTMLTFTVCPQLSEETLEQTVANLEVLQLRFGMPIVLENPPQYFRVPGSTMGLVDFIEALAERSGVGFILDLSHLLIAGANMGFEAARELDRIPLERVVEFHLSGIKWQDGIAWDDHASGAPEEAFALLRQALRRARPRAVTLEYNADPGFADDVLIADVARVNELLDTAA